MFRIISPDSVPSGRTCPANLGVRSCPVRKLICPVRLSPNFNFRSWNGYNDELVWAALWLHKATGESDYLTKAQNWFTEFEFEGINEVFSWDDKVAGAKILLAEATGSSNDISSVRTLCQTYVDYPRSPQGRTHFMQWGSNRYASNGAFICLKVSLLF